MSALVILNLLNELGKKDKMRGFANSIEPDQTAHLQMEWQTV